MTGQAGDSTGCDQRRLFTIAMRDYTNATPAFTKGIDEQATAIQSWWCDPGLGERAFTAHPIPPLATRRDVQDLVHHGGLRTVGSADVGGAVAGHWERVMQVGHAVCTACGAPPDEETMHRGPGGLAEGASAVHRALADLLSPDVDRLRLGSARTARLFLVTAMGDQLTHMRLRCSAPRPPGTPRTCSRSSSTER